MSSEQGHRAWRKRESEKAQRGGTDCFCVFFLRVPRTTVFLCNFRRTALLTPYTRHTIYIHFLFSMCLVFHVPCRMDQYTNTVLYMYLHFRGHNRSQQVTVHRSQYHTEYGRLQAVLQGYGTVQNCSGGQIIHSFETLG